MSKKAAVKPAKDAKLPTSKLKALASKGAKEKEEKQPVKAAKVKGEPKEKKEKGPKAERQTNYIYPAEINTPELKKNHRAKMRKTVGSFEKKLRIAGKKGATKDGKTKEQIQKAFDAFKKANFNGKAE